MRWFSRSTPLSVLAISLAIVPPAQADEVQVRITGKVAFSNLGSGVFAGAAFQDTAELVFNATVPGNTIAPGQLTDHPIDMASMVMTIGSQQVGPIIPPPAQFFPPSIGIANNFPVTDTFELNETALASSLYTIAVIARDDTGAVFATTDLASLPATTPQAAFTAGLYFGIIDYAPTGGEVYFEDVVIHIGATSCLCDWTGDDTLNSDDFFAFLDDFFAGAGDYNGDGPTNSDDFFAFLDCFFNPVPPC